MGVPVAIVGGGLTGLALARHLHAAGVAFQLFEARDRLGGRVLTCDAEGAFDLGPSWFWPGQPRMAQILQDLGLATFEQHAAGALIYETETGEVIRDRGFSSMQGSLRVQDGMGALVSGLAAGLPPDRIATGHALRSVSRTGGLRFANGATVQADRVVLALPPRLAATIAFSPPLALPVLAALRAIPTWMAGHAKLVAVYDAPFWREAGLSGDAMSRRGPLVKIHDASAGSRGALFGFVGVPPSVRTGQESTLREAALAQLGRMFGSKAATPLEVFYTDWAAEGYTAVDADARPLHHHPAYGRPQALSTAVWGQVHFAGTELAPDMGGYLEGALTSAEAMAQTLLGDLADLT